MAQKMHKNSEITGTIQALKSLEKTSKMQKEILTIEEAAEFLQLSKRSLYKLLREDEIPGRKILNKWRFERESLKRWLNKGQ